MIVGPRAAGKTTSARRLAADVLRLDHPATAAAVAADPDAALRQATKPVLVDEWQEVPTILGAVKRAVDADSRPGQFILTGSVESDLGSSVWPGTGRIIRVVMRGLTQRELAGSCVGGLLPILLAGQLSDISVDRRLRHEDYIQLAAAGGFPEPLLRLSQADRQRWLDSYVSHAVARDLKAADQDRDPVRLARYLEALALSTAGLPTAATLSAATELNQRTVAAYHRLLGQLYLVDDLPAWSSNRLSRLTKRKKLYLTDTGLAMAAARVDELTALRDGDLLGRLIDTFVVAQLRPEIELNSPRTRLHHLRDSSGHEIDVVLDLGAGRLIGIEIKAGSAPGPSDAKHLRWLRDHLGSDFVRGVVFHTGSMPFEMSDRIWALPISSIWSTQPTGTSTACRPGAPWGTHGTDLRRNHRFAYLWPLGRPDRTLPDD